MWSFFLVDCSEAFEIHFFFLFFFLLEDIVDGEGIEATEGDLVEINYVCRRSNGYFVHRYVFHLLVFCNIT